MQWKLLRSKPANKKKKQPQAVGYSQNKASDNQQKESSSRQPKLDSCNTTCGLCGGGYPHQGNCPAKLHVMPGSGATVNI